MTGRRKNPPIHLLDAYGCTKEQWLFLRDFGLSMVEVGASKDATPLRAYQHQRFAAESRRGIPFRLTIWEWWGIWQASGKWPERGVGRGYMMCRKGDKGAYEAGNVYIGPGDKNLSDAAKKCDLPIGVAHAAKGVAKPYRAYCNINRKQRHLGMFATVEEARSAYLKARALDELSRDQNPDPERKVAS